MKSRKERERELQELAETQDGQAFILWKCLTLVGDTGKIDTPYAVLIEAILAHEYPDME